MKLTYKRIFISGGAGFIGSNLANYFLDKNFSVTVYDNLLLGREEFLADLKEKKNFRFVKADLLELKTLKKEIAGHDIVWHLAANSHIDKGTKYTDLDLKLGTIVTYNLLEAMRVNGIKQIVFASSSAVYGLPDVLPTPENYGPYFPISLYGASKLACEGLISAFCFNYDMKSWIFRYANVVGGNATHGVVFVLIHKLKKYTMVLNILCVGSQAKPNKYVVECVEGMIYVVENAHDRVNFFNLGSPGAVSVTEIATILVESMGLKDVTFQFTGGEGGWLGDVPQVRLDTSKMEELGWKPKLTSREAVQKGIRVLLEQDQKP